VSVLVRKSCFQVKKNTHTQMSEMSVRLNMVSHFRSMIIYFYFFTFCIDATAVLIEAVFDDAQHVDSIRWLALEGLAFFDLRVEDSAFAVSLFYRAN